jgi:hypothetical protein
VDLDLGGDVDVGDLGGGTAEMDADAAGDASHAAKILSMRTLIYALFGFGAVGTLLSALGSGGFLTNLVFAAAGGALSGALVTMVFNYLKATDSGAQPSDDGYVGLSGVVTIPISLASPGAVAVQRGQRRISLRALPHESLPVADPSTWKAVVVVEMVRGIARVVPVDDSLSLEP